MDRFRRHMKRYKARLLKDGDPSIHNEENKMAFQTAEWKDGQLDFHEPGVPWPPEPTKAELKRADVRHVTFSLSLRPFALPIRASTFAFFVC